MSDMLKEFVRGVLKEAAFTPVQAAAEGLALWVNKDASGVDLTLYDPTVLERELASGVRPSEAVTSSVVGTMSLTKPKNKCHGAWEINSAAAMGGFGPLMYDLSRSIVPGGKIISDRDAVSNDAKGVWTFYLRNRGDVEKLPLDNVYNPKTPPKEDDCKVFKPEMVNGVDMNPLNYALGGKGPSPAKLKANHSKAAAKLAALLGSPSKLEQLMYGASNSFFVGRLPKDANEFNTDSDFG